MLIIGIGPSTTFVIEESLQYVEPYKKSLPEKQRIQLRIIDHKVAEEIYVTGILAG